MAATSDVTIAVTNDSTIASATDSLIDSTTAPCGEQAKCGRLIYEGTCKRSIRGLNGANWQVLNANEYEFAGFYYGCWNWRHRGHVGSMRTPDSFSLSLSPPHLLSLFFSSSNNNISPKYILLHPIRFVLLIIYYIDFDHSVAFHYLAFFSLSLFSHFSLTFISFFSHFSLIDNSYFTLTC